MRAAADWILHSATIAAAAVWLRPSAKAGFAVPEGKVEWGASLREGWVGLGRMLREWRKLPNTFIFLGAWFLLSDGKRH